MKRITKETKEEIQDLKIGEEILIWNRICNVSECVYCGSKFPRANKKLTSRSTGLLTIQIRQANQKTCTEKCRRAYKSQGYRK